MSLSLQTTHLRTYKDRESSDSIAIEEILDNESSKVSIDISDLGSLSGYLINIQCF